MLDYAPLAAVIIAAGIDIKLSVFAVLAFVTVGVGLAMMILFTRAKLVSTDDCTLYINNDDELTKTVPGGGTLLDALTGNGVPIPSPCGGKATCKQCKVQVLEGGGEPLGTELGTFSKKQLKEGWRLSCQCKVKEDLKLHVEEELLGVKEWSAKVVRNDNVATFIKELVVEVPEEVPYRSGGYLQIHVPPYKTNTEEWKQTMEEKYYEDWEKFGLFGVDVDFGHIATEDIRAYSMASYPAEGKKVMFNIRIATPPFQGGKLAPGIPWGMCSSYTFSLKPGDEIKISGPYGESFMIDDDRELIFLIGGAGSSFGRSHIMHLLRTENSKRKISMWYGARSIKENIYQEEYEELEKDFDNFSYHLVLSEPTKEDIAEGWPTDDPTKTNFLFRAFEEGKLKQMDEPEECLFYCCGPPLHNSSVMKLLDDYGVPRESIVLDDFGS
ncbi:MAG: NADH:ubiquinone reductase (Na(+)-transporting) subunit F [Waddliaceae bacterium]|nr:NADH:ubiquinone reductase (Na(+)-transporting) subunit F [Waddliaceae bacterium]